MSAASDEVVQLRSEVSRMRDLLDRRPALNAGLVDAYVQWTSLVYRSDQAAVEMRFVRDGSIPTH